ncbi:eukaryotic mitochondrial regulator protein-domain-containing protein [Echria macrotheca]|uniref:Eukaryotic mitochondrial regulator protein-domain-containing protein n=1 Tax=Echria macrotheca TaxID=438768 RepID=A0AAJ0BHH5_9PEZI|nr:eukaryotic mitochondrial regulator protein-domain-containing protein [Echria macrotheca]
MPPRLPPTCSAQGIRCLKNVVITAQEPKTAAGRLLWRSSRAPFSSSASVSASDPRQQTTPEQEDFYKWCEFEAPKYAYKKQGDPPGPVYPRPPGGRGGAGETNKLRPFPQNPEFISQPVLSEAARDSIWKDVMERGLPIKAVSARRNVDMLRVAAVIRMKAIEKQWAAEGKELAEKYSDTMLNMLPVHHLEDTEEPFEPINEVYVHSKTQQQLFVPTSESRHFTRVDAAKAFGEKVLPPDQKIRIPELIGFEKELADGVDGKEARVNFLRETSTNEKELAAKMARRAQNDESKRMRLKSGRFEFRIENVNADAVGKNGRSRLATGWRYGVPHGDRRRGAVKIPTKVE